VSVEFDDYKRAATGKLDYVTSSTSSSSAARLDIGRRRLCVLYAVSYSGHSTPCMGHKNEPLYFLPSVPYFLVDFYIFVSIQTGKNTGQCDYFDIVTALHCNVHNFISLS